MPRYYLHLEDDDGTLHDGNGFDATSDNGAIRYAVMAAGQMIYDEFQRGALPVSFCLCLDDETGKHLATLPVNAAIEGL